MFHSVLMMMFPLAMAFAAATDLLTFKIPNRISLALIAGFLVVAPLSGMSWTTFFLHVATFAAVLAVGFALFSAGLFGGGDAKLLAAAALWVGYDSMPMYAAMVAICGGVLAVALLLFRRLPLPPVLMQHAWIERLHSRESGMPYGIALAAAALWIYPSTALYSRLIV